MNIIKKFFYRKKDEEIKELKLKLIEAHGSYSRLKNKESSLNKELGLGIKLQRTLFDLVDKLKKDLETEKEMRERLDEETSILREEVDRLRSAMCIQEESMKSKVRLRVKSKRKELEVMISQAKAVEIKWFYKIRVIESTQHDIIAENKKLKREIRELKE